MSYVNFRRAHESETTRKKKCCFESANLREQTNKRTNELMYRANERVNTSDHKIVPRKRPWTACSFTFVYEIETNANIPIKQNIWF